MSVLVVAALLLAYWVLVPGGWGPSARAAEVPDGKIVNSVANYGWTEGDFSVSEDGQARYDLPLWVPPGRGKVVPDLSLSYSSDSGNGLIGVGWAMSGLSSIAPCPKSFRYDGATDGVRFAASDALCLGGVRLVPMPGSAGAEREYRTEQEMFAKIVAFGMADGSPESFKVWAKDGTISTFGGTADSKLEAFRLIAGSTPNTLVRQSTTARVVVSWSLSKVEDRNGNAASYEYEEDEGNAAQLWHVASRLKKIKYEPNREVRFSYETRNDVIESYGVGVHFRESKRLSGVELWGAAEGDDIERLRSYDLAYGNTGTITRRSLLTSVTECGSDDVCKQPLTFNWSMGGFEFEAIDTEVKDGGQEHPLDLPRADVDSRLIVGDFNGDGKDDLVYPRTNFRLQQGQRQVWAIRLGTATGFGPSNETGFQPPPQGCGAFDHADDCTSGLGQVRPVDIEFDGKLELLVWVPVTGGNKWRLYQYTGPGFQVMPDVDDNVDTDNDPNPAFFGDIDGNGLADFITARADFTFDDHSLDGPWTYRLNTGRGGANRWGPKVNTGRTTPSSFGLRDVNADGRIDMANPSGGFGLGPTGQLENRVSHSSGGQAGADINGDGLADGVIVFDSNVLKNEAPLMPAGQLKGSLNTGTGFTPFSPAAANYFEPFTACPPEAPPQGVDEHPCRARWAGFDRGVRYVDFNGDGAQDVLVFRGAAPSGNDDAHKGVQLYAWRDGKFERIQLGGNGLNAGPNRGLLGFNNRHVLDFNGDGALDILHVQGDHLRLLKRTSGLPDQLIGIGDASKSKRIEVDYTTLADGAVHTLKTSTFPVVPISAGRTIVKQHRFARQVPSSASVQWDRFNHTYEGARMDLQGRGWLGFSKHDLTRLSTGMTVKTEYRNDDYDAPTKSYPYAFMPAKTVTRGAHATPVEERVDERTVTNTLSAKRYANGSFFVETTQVTNVVRDMLATATASTPDHQTVTDTLYDNFGNPAMITSTTTGGRKVTTDPTYRNDTARWLIGLPTRNLVTSCVSAAAGADCLTRETTADYDQETGNPTVSTVEPNKAALKLTTTTSYGAFGVVTSVEKADNGGVKRKDSFEYGNDDKLAPTATVNAEGHRTVIETHSGLGVPLKTTDPNGQETSYAYDRFGRIRETHRSESVV